MGLSFHFHQLTCHASDSVRDVAGTVAYHMMSYYDANATSTPHVGDLPKPYFWWQAGAMWNAALDYFYYTGDSSYNHVVTAALSNRWSTGDDFDYAPERHSGGDLLNEDIFYWAAAALSAAERNFPQPDGDIPSWLEMAGNAFDGLTGGWSDDTCGGGVSWQRDEVSYKDAATNGGLFQLAARLARATDDDGGKYVEWAEKAWDWTVDVGLLTEDYYVYAFMHVGHKCEGGSKLQYSHAAGIYLYGAAVMANYTGEKKWTERAEGLLSATEIFFSNKTRMDEEAGGEEGVLWEVACERIESCNTDMRAYKGILARYMWQSVHMMPSMEDTVRSRLTPSAEMAALTCTGGDSGECGFAWYTGENDGRNDLSSEMSALETIQGLLIGETSPPLSAKEIKRVGSDGPSSKGSGGKDGDEDGDEDEDEDDGNAAGALGASLRGAALAAGASLVATFFA